MKTNRERLKKLPENRKQLNSTGRGQLERMVVFPSFSEMLTPNICRWVTAFLFRKLFLILLWSDFQEEWEVQKELTENILQHL